MKFQNAVLAVMVLLVVGMFGCGIKNQPSQEWVSYGFGAHKVEAPCPTELVNAYLRVAEKAVNTGMARIPEYPPMRKAVLDVAFLTEIHRVRVTVAKSAHTSIAVCVDSFPGRTEFMAEIHGLKLDLDSRSLSRVPDWKLADQVCVHTPDLAPRKMGIYMADPAHVQGLIALANTVLARKF